MKIVYVITSAGRDAYTAMTRVSAASLRMTNPGAKIVVACDAETDRAVRASNDPLLGEVDEWLAFETPPGEAAFRNRFLKTSLRQRVSGEYLFLDSDTIVRDDLAPVFRMGGDIAGAPAHAREEHPCCIWSGDQKTLDEMQWAIGRELYVCGGVLWVSESDGAHRFYRLWHEKWQAAHRQLGEFRDQPALNSAIHDSHVACARLPVRYNAQICANPLCMPDAAVWHYFYSLRYQAHSHIDELIQTAMEANAVDAGRLRELMRSQVLWPRPFWLIGPGVHMINGSVRDLMTAVETGQDAGAMFQAMLRVDPFYAERVLAKTLVDSYWGEVPRSFRFARKLIFLRHPRCLAQKSVRQCLVHAVCRRAQAVRTAFPAGPRGKFPEK